MISSKMSVIKRRSSNYSRYEIDCLLSYLESNPDLVSSRLGRQYRSLNDIKVAWDELAEKLAEVGGYCASSRSGQEVKRKWADLKSRVKAKAATIAMETNVEGAQPTLSVTPLEERVLGIISLSQEDASSASASNREKASAVKVFSFHTDSNPEDGFHDLTGSDDKNASDNLDAAEIIEEIKVCGNEDKKRRLSEAFFSALAEKAPTTKKFKANSEEEQLEQLCKSQTEINIELRSIKDILKKCQTSIEKIALLKRAELRLKCAKHGVDFDDLFD